jgi:hypothetical protein
MVITLCNSQAAWVTPERKHSASQNLLPEPQGLARSVAGPTESQAHGSWYGHAGAGFVGTAPVPWPSLLPVLI